MAIFNEQSKEEENAQSAEDSGGIPELSAPTPPSSAPAVSGQSVGGAGNATSGPKASSSGSFQDFSKFQDANKGKIQALSNLTTGGARQQATDANTKVNTAVASADSAIKDSYGNAEDYSDINKDNVQNQEGRIAEGNNYLGGTIDYTKDNTFGAQDAVNAQQDYGTAVQNIAGATDRAGVGQLLSGLRNGGAKAANAGDSLLLRGNQGFRQNMADTVTGIQSDFQANTTGDNSAMARVSALGNLANEERAAQLGAMNQQVEGAQVERKNMLDQQAAMRAIAAASARAAASQRVAQEKAQKKAQAAAQIVADQTARANERMLAGQRRQEEIARIRAEAAKQYPSLDLGPTDRGSGGIEEWEREQRGYGF